LRKGLNKYILFFIIINVFQKKWISDSVNK
jgi:hypothetical protein